MKIKGAFLTKNKTKKGAYLYDFLTNMGGRQVILKIVSLSDYPLNKELEVELSLSNRVVYFCK